MERMNYMLQEQRKINEELMGQMKQMQRSMMDMRTRMSGSGGGSMRFGGGDGSLMRGGGGWSRDDNYDDYGGFGSGYGEAGFGGGKMFWSGSRFTGQCRSVPYNTRVAEQEGDWDCPGE